MWEWCPHLLPRRTGGQLWDSESWWGLIDSVSCDILFSLPCYHKVFTKTFTKTLSALELFLLYACWLLTVVIANKVVARRLLRWELPPHQRRGCPHLWSFPSLCFKGKSETISPDRCVWASLAYLCIWSSEEMFISLLNTV